MLQWCGACPGDSALSKTKVCMRYYIGIQCFVGLELHRREVHGADSGAEYEQISACWNTEVDLEQQPGFHAKLPNDCSLWRPQVPCSSF